MHLPTDPTPSPPPSENITDLAPLITPEQRENDFNRLFAWHGVEIAITLANELYYRELRVHMNAPALASYDTMGDFAPEGARVLYCAHLDAASIRKLRLMSGEHQIAVHDAWVLKNIGIHEISAVSKLAQDMQECVARARASVMPTGEGVDGSGNSPCHP
jgi:hypothetical protein